MKNFISIIALLSIGMTSNAFAIDWYQDRAFAQAENIYQQAADGNSAKVETALTQFNELKQQHKESPVINVRIGSLTTMQARDAFAPWNKMRYAETGLDMIDRALDSLSDNSTSADIVRSIPVDVDVKFTTAVTFSSMPKMFKRWGQAERLFDSVANSSTFEQLPNEFRATFWKYRIRHAEQLGKTDLAKQWSARADSVSSR